MCHGIGYLVCADVCSGHSICLVFSVINLMVSYLGKNQEFSSPFSRAGYPYGAAEIFSLMQHMGCEPDRASYNILVDAYGKAGFQDGNYLLLEVIILFC